MKKLELNQMEGLEGGKFWGWSSWKATGDCVNGFQTFVRHYDMFWITSSYDYDFRAC